MSRCQAGDCEVECGGGKGCGCIAESDNPANCTCICSGGRAGGGLTFEPTSIVDVSLNDLPLFEVAGFLNGVYAENIVVPSRRLSEPVSLNLKSKPFASVLDQLGLATTESIERDKRRIGLPFFLAGFVLGALLFRLAFRRRDE